LLPNFDVYLKEHKMIDFDRILYYLISFKKINLFQATGFDIPMWR